MPPGTAELVWRFMIRPEKEFLVEVADGRRSFLCSIISLPCSLVDVSDLD
jgi:hypothetical protein